MRNIKKYIFNYYKIFPIYIILFFYIYSCILNTEQEQDITNYVNIYTLVDTCFLPAGIYQISWLQIDSNGIQIDTGIYTVKLSTGSFSDKEELFINFNISDNYTHVPLPADINSSDPQPLPVNYSISVNSNTYSLGDTVLVTYELPKHDSDILVEILK